jgi:hypothetical protein
MDVATVWKCTSIAGRIVLVFILGSEATRWRLCIGNNAAVLFSDPEVATICMYLIPCRVILHFVLDSEVIACRSWFIINLLSSHHLTRRSLFAVGLE